MLAAFLAVFAVAAAVALHRAYRSYSTSPTVAAPQDLTRFLTMGALRDRRRRALALAFHAAVATSLGGHLFLLVEEVPPLLPRVGTAVGLAALALLAVLAAARGVRRAPVFASALATVATGVAMGLAAPREELVKLAWSWPASPSAAGLLLAVHVASASALALSLAYTCHISAPAVYLAARLVKKPKFKFINM
ncbi:hypothetical protein [Pyrobaculum neutrophilum]|uniref:Respiratory chain protein n=1 Tax=Pyrobaculum neutrophilum (strain DSM 2338 / JCM 9278 / NBRC 100436 / V24Sta) TaxID=444157 RepID=B1YE03_PYRNV|nr:hypothetical protein [Pyrobaculum neutrophilum]ACB40016.1 hypothetical protein Tneu_1085 [Pyrobaculum neutrophilum V24Sta]